MKLKLNGLPQTPENGANARMSMLDVLLLERMMSDIDQHPDSHALNDWALYGPQDARISDAVWRLAMDKKMRLADIEMLMLIALENRLAEADDT